MPLYITLVFSFFFCHCSIFFFFCCYSMCLLCFSCSSAAVPGGGLFSCPVHNCSSCLCTVLNAYLLFFCRQNPTVKISMTTEPARSNILLSLNKPKLLFCPLSIPCSEHPTTDGAGERNIGGFCGRYHLPRPQSGVLLAVSRAHHGGPPRGAGERCYNILHSGGDGRVC